MRVIYKNRAGWIAAAWIAFSWISAAGVAHAIDAVGGADSAKIGDRPPAWSDLPKARGGTASLDDFKDKKALIVVFTCNNCPVAQAYEQRINQLAKAYQDKSVALVAINVNRGETLESMKQRAESRGFAFPYVYDESQQTAKAYGAQCTPHCFLLDQDRKIAYMGSIDDEMREDEVKKHYLAAAIESVLKGDKPATAETRAFGCGIRWK